MATAAAERELQILFEAFGRVDSIVMVVGQDFAYVKMDIDVEACDAIRALNGTKLYGKDLDVREARPRHYRKPQTHKPKVSSFLQDK